jgi:hypothetical protein
MKALTFVIFLSLLLLALPGSSAEKKGGKENGPKAKFYAKYDTNHNGVIDADEKAAVRKDFAAAPDGDLQRFDMNKDGKLDDEEIAAIKPPSGKKKGADKKEEGSNKEEKPKDEKDDKNASATKP